jgi:hypothetical protein
VVKTKTTTAKTDGFLRQFFFHFKGTSFKMQNGGMVGGIRATGHLLILSTRLGLCMDNFVLCSVRTLNLKSFKETVRPDLYGLKSPFSKEIVRLSNLCISPSLTLYS